MRRPFRFRKMVLWGSPTAADGQEGRAGGRERRRPRADNQDSSVLADTSEFHVFARTGRLDIDGKALAEQVGRDGFEAAAFIQQHMAHLNNAGLEVARSELEQFMVSVQNQVRRTVLCAETYTGTVLARLG